MEFDEGDIVEVWRKDESTFGSWWPAKIISTYGHTCCVRYEQLVNSDGNKIVNAVDIEDLRPLQAPSFGRGGSLMAGHTVEVFDGLCWRVVKVIKVLPSEWLLVRFGSSDEGIKIHKTEIRIPQMCSGRKWASLGKVLLFFPSIFCLSCLWLLIFMVLIFIYRFTLLHLSEI